MKTLYVITRSELGGAQTHLVDLLRGLSGSVEASVACGAADIESARRGQYPDYLTGELARLEIPIHVVSGLVQPIEPAADARALFQLVALMRRLRPDLVHAHTSKAGLLGRLAARIAGVPSVFTAHTWSFAEGTSLKWKLLGIPPVKGSRAVARAK